MSDDPLIVDRTLAGIAVLTFNRPNARNALSLRLRHLISQTLRTLESSGDTHVVILTGAGDAFCAGLDLKELGETVDALNEVGSPDNPIAAMLEFTGIIIGAVNGSAITGGFELALTCDILLASERAMFADTHRRVGVLPGWGLSQILSRTIGVYRAKQISLTGEVVSAAQAQDFGLVGTVVAHEELLPTALKMADRMLQVGPRMLRAQKKLIEDGFRMNYSDARALETCRSQEHNRQVTPDSIANWKSVVREP